MTLVMLTKGAPATADGRSAVLASRQERMAHAVLFIAAERLPNTATAFEMKLNRHFVPWAWMTSLCVQHD
jgi:hypothetical protein